MNHMNSQTTICYEHRNGSFTLLTPVGVVRGNSKAECRTAFLRYVTEHPDRLVDALMPKDALYVAADGDDQEF